MNTIVQKSAQGVDSNPPAPKFTFAASSKGVAGGTNPVDPVGD